MKRRGFTLIELVMVIVILGILAVVAIPQYFNLVARANQSAELGVVGGVRAGIATRYAQNILDPAIASTFPPTLDDAADGAAGTGVQEFFENVLSDPIVDPNWSKAGLVYTGPAGNAYTYTPATGAFR